MTSSSLSASAVECVLETTARLKIGVLGDLFLDRYLDLDATLTEPSLETGLDAYQVVRVRPSPGAAGTVVNNLVALGVASVLPLAVIGDDGEGYELRQVLGQMRGVDSSRVFTWPGRRTPTYTKPMLHEPGQAPRELNRLDIHNRSPLPADAQARLLELLETTLPDLDGLVVMDQVSLPDRGVVTAAVRERVRELSGRLSVLADSRERIGLFRDVCLKPNQRECLRAVGGERGDLASAVIRLCKKANSMVFCTRGENGILLGRPGRDRLDEIPGYPVMGPIDPVGAGDSTSAGIICALASGLTHAEAAAFGNLVASITVQQIGTTGVATPEQVRRRFRETSQG
jgi:bifunctional ADP-heptose synthase (sugar kinase/adenylyltransferase)